MAGRQYEVEFRLAGDIESSFRRTFTTASDDFKKLYKQAEMLNKKGLVGSNLTRPLREDLKRTQAEMWNTETSVNRMSGVFRKAIIPLTAGLGVGTLAFNSLKKSMDFEEQLDSIQAVSGLSQGEMKKVHELALDLGAKTKYSALEAAQGMEELIKAGMSTSQVIGGGLEASLNLAAAGGLGLADSSEIMATAMNAFKSDGLAAAKVADILVGAANASATDVMELKMSLSQASAVASGVGMSFKDTNMALGLFANNGLKGSDAGTSLKTMLSNLVPKTNEAISLFNDFSLFTMDSAASMEFLHKKGIKPTSNSVDDINKSMEKYVSTQQKVKVGTDKAAKATQKFMMANNLVHSAFYDQKGDLRSLEEIAGILQDRFGGLTAEQRQFNLNQIFGSDAIRAANVLYKEGAQGVAKFNEEMSQVTALDVAKKRMDNAKGAVEQFRGAMETLQISALEPTLPLIKDLALKAADASEEFQAWMDTRQAKEWGNALLTTLKVAPKLILAVGAATAVFKTGKGVANVVGFSKGLLGVQSSSKSAAAGVSVAAKATRMFGMAATFLSNPLGLAAAGVGALTLGVVAYKRHQVQARQELLNMKTTLETAFTKYDGVVQHTQKTKDLIKEYDRLNDKIKDSKTPATEVAEARRKLADVEQDLIDLNPDIIKSESAKTDALREQAGLADRLNEAKQKMSEIELQKTVTDNIAKRPKLEKEYSNLKSDVPRYESAYKKDTADYTLYTEFIVRHNEIIKNNRLSLEDQQTQMDSLLQELEKATGKTYINWSNVYDEANALKKSSDENYDNLLKANEELDQVQQSYEAMYVVAKKYYEQETGMSGTLEDQAKKYQFMTDEQKKHFQEAFDKVYKLRQEMALLPVKTIMELEVIQKTSGITPKPSPSDAIPEPFRFKPPKLPGFADGGFSNQPSIFGEAGLEAAIPINNKPRSHAILDRVNQMMGRSEQPKGRGFAAVAVAASQPRQVVQPERKAPNTINEFGTAAPITIEHKPSIVVQGSADQNVIMLIEQALQKSNEDLGRKIEAYFRQKARVSMRGV